MLEVEKKMVNIKVSDLIEQGETLIQDNSSKSTVTHLIEEMKQK